MQFVRFLIGPDNGYQTMAQLSMRAVVMLAFGILCIRIAGRRAFAQASPLDIIIYLIIGSNLSRVITGKANVFPAIAATLTLVIVHRLLAYATLHKSAFSSMLKAEPTVLIRNGTTDEVAMRKKGIGNEDLMEALRLKQIEAIEDVRLAVLERGGEISALRFEK
jgi:uncharacterized membrane protein YcaP (DUF421 family)